MTPLNIALLTISDTRTLENDHSGSWLQEAIVNAGHEVVARELVADDVYVIRAVVSNWIAAADVDVIISTGGTGLTGRDGTPEALSPLMDKTIEGFGELFRMLSFDDIGPSTIQSRCLAGVANGTFVFALPGSSSAVKLAWEMILRSQLDDETRPCNFAMLIPRLKE